MWGIVLSVFVAIVLVWGMNDEKLVKGRWGVDSVMRCPDVDQYRYRWDMKKSKLNRTHDGFDVSMDFKDAITENSHGLDVQWCKKMDGGCKPIYQLTPSSLCKFAKETTESNFRTVLENIGVENLDCPIPEGEYTITKYIFNYEDLPEESMPGEFIATAYLLMGSERVLCTMMEVTFTELEDE